MNKKAPSRSAAAGQATSVRSVFGSTPRRRESLVQEDSQPRELSTDLVADEQLLRIDAAPTRAGASKARVRNRPTATAAGIQLTRKLSGRKAADRWRFGRSFRYQRETGRHWQRVTTVEDGRVEMWRGICRSDISVSAPFVWRCLSGSTVAPFPHPAHRTGRADFPHPARTRPHAFVLACDAICGS